MEYFRLLFDHLAWIEHEFLSDIRDSRKAGSLCGTMRGVGRVRKSIHQSWLAKGYYVEVLREFSKRFCRKRPVLFKSGPWHFHQDNTPVLVTDYLTKMGIKTVPHRPYSPDPAPCDFWLFPKLRGCRYETIEAMKEAVTKVIDTLTQEYFHEPFLGTVPQVHCGQRRLLRRGLDFHVCTINKRVHTKKVLKLIVCPSDLIHRYDPNSNVFTNLVHKQGVIQGKF